MSGPCGPRPFPHSCSVFLLDQNELVAKVFDGGVVEDEVRQGRAERVCGVVLGTGRPQWGLRSRLDTRRPALWLAANLLLPAHACSGRAMRSASQQTRVSQATWPPQARS